MVVGAAAIAYESIQTLADGPVLRSSVSDSDREVHGVAAARQKPVERRDPRGGDILLADEKCHHRLPLWSSGCPVSQRRRINSARESTDSRHSGSRSSTLASVRP